MQYSEEMKEVTLSAIGSALTGHTFDAAPLSVWDSNALEKLYVFSSALDVSQFIGYALADTQQPNAILQRFQKDALKAMYRCERQTADLQRVSALFEQEKLPFVPLKGAVLRGFYPVPWLRTSSDIDLLLRSEDCRTAEALLSSRLHYAFVERTTHDVVLVSPGGVHVELHHMLLEEACANQADEPLRNIWYHVRQESDSFRCTLDDEAFYYYHIAHIAKHFLLGGGGIRPFADLFLLDAMPRFAACQRDMLEQGGLLRFSQSCSKLANHWFGGGQADDGISQMEAFLLEGTLYGSAHGKAVVGSVKSGGKMKRLLQRAWQPYDTLKHRYPALIGYPILLPWYEGVRWAQLLTSRRRGNLKEELVSGLTLSKEEQRKISAMLEHIGL